MPPAWMYEGVKVYVSGKAEIPPEYRASGDQHDPVQDVLDQTPPWEKDDNPIRTMAGLKYSFVAVVIETFGAPVTWAKHTGHRDKDVGLSSFIRAQRSYTREFTVHLEGTSRRPMVVRAYPGEYTPPLPWQGTARQADGGIDACLKFWRTHAYVITSRVIIPESKSDTPPDWFRSA